MQNTIKITRDMALKDIRAIAKLQVPKKAKTMRYWIGEEKEARFDKANNLDLLHETDAVADFSAVPLAKVKKDPAAFGSSIPLKGGKSNKGKESPGDKVARVGTGFIKLIDELLVGGGDTIGSAATKVMKAFPDKDPKSVRRIVSNRPNARKRANLSEAKWLPTNTGTGVMGRIDALYKDGGHYFKDIVSMIIKEFPKDSKGEPRNFEATARVARNRARILRKANKPVNYVRNTPVAAPKAKPAKPAKNAAKPARKAKKD